MRCLPCTKSWKALLRKAHNIKSTQKLKNKHRKLQNSILNCKRLEERLRSKISKLCHKIKDLKNKCSKCNEKAIKDVIQKLPQNQQLAVETCFAAAKLNDKKGMRYSTEWVYECILLRIKSSKTYNHLRSHNILTLPSIEQEVAEKTRIKRQISPFQGYHIIFNVEQLQINGYPYSNKFSICHRASHKRYYFLVIILFMLDWAIDTNHRLYLQRRNCCQNL